MQGDIFVAPTTVLRGMGLTAGPLTPTVPPLLGECSLSAAWLPGSGESGHVPDVTHDTRFGAVIVLSHECEIEKDHNAYVKLRIKVGASRNTVERQLLAKGLRLASLADEPRAVLRASLKRVFATRDISKWHELEAAIGQRILDIQKNAANKKSVGGANDAGAPDERLDHSDILRDHRS